MRPSPTPPLLVGLSATLIGLPGWGQGQGPGEPKPVPIPSLDKRFQVDTATGALSWCLPVGVVPGDLPLPVVFRFQASMRSDAVAGSSRAEETLQKDIQYRGIWAGLDFGFLSRSRPELGQAGEEGSQYLEDGTIFRDRDWRGWVKDGGLPASFGLRAKEAGYATEPSHTYGLYAAALADLGTWGPRVSKLTSATQFQVLLDRTKARIFSYQEELKGFVPVLWVDRFGHWIGFHWQTTARSTGQAITVKATNASGNGIQVCWGRPNDSGEPADLLRADFIGIPAPSLLVRGYPGPAIWLPGVLAGAKVIPVPPEAGTPVGRPTEVLLGAPGDLPVPGFVEALPQAYNAQLI